MHHKASGILFPDQGSHLYPLQWRLNHQGSPSGSHFGVNKFSDSLRANFGWARVGGSWTPLREKGYQGQDWQTFLPSTAQEPRGPPAAVSHRCLLFCGSVCTSGRFSGAHSCLRLGRQSQTFHCTAGCPPASLIYLAHRLTVPILFPNFFQKAFEGRDWACSPLGKDATGIQTYRTDSSPSAAILRAISAPALLVSAGGHGLSAVSPTKPSTEIPDLGRDTTNKPKVKPMKTLKRKTNNKTPYSKRTRENKTRFKSRRGDSYYSHFRGYKKEGREMDLRETYICI